MKCRSAALLSPQEEELTVSPDVSLCFDQVWAEPAAVSRVNAGEAAAKAFVARDLHGAATFLCLLRARAGQLSVIPVETKRRRRKDTVEFIRNAARGGQNQDPDEEVGQEDDGLFRFRAKLLI